MSLVAIVLFRAPFWSRVLRLGLAIGFEELRIAAYHLGRLTERPDECAPHPLAIRKAGFGGDRLNRMACLLHHDARGLDPQVLDRSEEHTSELQSLMRISYAVFCLKQQNKKILKR